LFPLAPTFSISHEIDLLDDIDTRQAHLKNMDIFLATQSAHFDSSRRVGSEEYNLERQYIKELLQYIREFRRDLFELIQELQRPIKSNGTATWSTSEQCARTHLKQDKAVWRPKSRSSFAANEVHELNDHRAGRSTGTMEPLHDLLSTPTEVGQPGDFHEHVAKQRWRCASPTMLSTAGSSCSGLASFMSTHWRTPRCLPLHIDRDDATEDAMPSAVVKGRDSFYSGESLYGEFDNATGMNIAADDVMEGLGI